MQTAWRWHAEPHDTWSPRYSLSTVDQVGRCVASVVVCWWVRSCARDPTDVKRWVVHVLWLVWVLICHVKENTPM